MAYPIGYFCLSLFMLFAAGTTVLAAPFPSRGERLDELRAKLEARGLSAEEIDRAFSDSRVALYPEIVRRSGKGLDYTGRRFGLLTKKSVNEGKRVLRENGGLLRKIESDFGVGKEILVAILRIETNFGRFVGTVPVFNSLLTMALIENRRSDWAGEELGHLLLISRKQNSDPLAIIGSWAGAFGIPQFVPSSYVRYGADGNGDEKVDLFTLADALASMANYLKAFGWSGNDPANRKEALYAYNRCDHYVQAVLAYARALKK